jgi:class 3 adenylate cyclase
VVEGLPEKRVGTRLGEALLIALRIARADDDHRDALERRHGLETLHHQVTVAGRQAQVEQNEIRTLMTCLIDGRDGVTGEDGFVPLPLEPDAKKATDVLVVVDDEDLGRGHMSQKSLYHWNRNPPMSQVVQDPLDAGREAARRGAWPEAYEHLSAADKDGGVLTGADLELLSQAALWTGHLGASIEFAERAYARFSDEGENLSAAKVALALAAEYRNKLQNSASAGWHQRAARLLEQEPESGPHGYLELQRSMIASGRGDYDAALEHIQRALEIASRHHDRDLLAQATLREGVARVNKGEVDDGLALIDEVTASAVAGDLNPMSTAIIYCNAIDACRDLADYGRAAEWTETATRWCDRQAIAGFPGMCRVDRAEIMRLRGDWSDADRELQQATEELQDFNPRVAGQAFYEIGEIRLRMGELEAAEQAFAQARDLARDPEPGLSLLRLAQGKIDGAARSIKRALDDESWGRLDRARLLPAQIEIALAAGDVRTARTAAEELEAITGDYTIAEARTPALEAAAQSAWGAVRLAENDPDAGITCFRRALKLWSQVDHPYEAARTRVLLAAAYRAQGDEDGAVSELSSAQSAFKRLGARLDAERVNQRLTRRVKKTFVFTDIVDSTKFSELLKGRWERVVLKVHDETIKRIVSDHGGEVVKSTGDGFFLAFPDPNAAVEAAVAVQKQLDDQAFPAEVRIGIHTTEAQDAGGDYQGEGINVAARIGELAEGGQILASCDSISGIPLVCSAPADAQLKGFIEPVKITAIDWR